MVWEESAYVIERENNRMVTESRLIRAAVWGLLSSKGGNAYDDSVKDLNVVVKPILKRRKQDAAPWQEKTSNS